MIDRSDAGLLRTMLRTRSPYKTGNLKYNGIASVQVIPKGYAVTIGGPNATYAIWTEVRNRSSKGWIKRTADDWAKIIAVRYKGRVL